MKRIVLTLALMAALLALPCRAASFELRGVWVSSVFNLDYPSRPGLSAEALQREADAILDNAARWGFNAVFLQVRPSGDALYRSDIFPWSAWLSGAQGRPADGDFDPLAYFIQRAHGLEIAVHAWINPYRITRTAQENRESALAQLAPLHPARDLGDAVVFHTDGCLYFDPGRPESRALIVAGVTEILDRYAVDGIHLDDYFYPAGDFDDQSTFARYGAGFDRVEDFRRASVTQLIQALQSSVKAHSPYTAFGVSPFGIWANESQHPEGSATRGDSSYFSHYADTRHWVQAGLLDYIIPQLYWQMGSQEADFETLLDWWNQTARGSGVRLYIGLAAYRVPEAEAGSPWFEGAEIARQIQRAQGAADGVCFFRYGSVAGDTALDSAMKAGFAAPAARYQLPYPLPPDRLEGADLSPDHQLEAGKPYPFTAQLPLGSTGTLLLEGQGFHLAQGPDGRAAALPEAGVSGTAFREEPLAVFWERGGFVRLEILPQPAQIVETGQPVGITDIFSQSAEGGEHRVTFVTGGPAACRLEQKGTSVQLWLAPCRMGVLFEDSYFESITFTQSGREGLYTLMLPVAAQGYGCNLLWQADRVTLTFRAGP